MRGLALLPACALILALLVQGCASDPSRLAPGGTRAEALQQLGRPTATYALPGGGERLQYSRQPSGYEVANVDIDAAGRVVSVTQALAHPLDASPIVIGQWREADVLRTFGRPYQVSRVTSFDGQVWSWQWKENNTPRLFYVFLDPDGVVVRFFAGDNPDILNTE